MKFLIAGLGSIGRRHFRNLLSLGEKDIVLFRSHHSTLPDDELAGFPVETDLEAALAQKPDAVIVSNPTALHLPVALAAAKAGCNIFIEKPVAHSHEGMKELVDLVLEKKVIAAVGFQFRFHPGLQAVREIIKENLIGQVVSASASWGEYLPGWHPWEDYRIGYAASAELGGGVVRTLCHPLDYLTWMFGRVQHVYASVESTGKLNIPVDDLAEIDMHFEGDVLAHLHLDYHRRPGSHTLNVVGTEGTLEWDNSTGIARYKQASKENWQDVALPEGFERNTMFMAEMNNFIQAIHGLEEPACSLEEGISNMQLIDAVYLSGKLHRQVTLNEVNW